MSDLPRCNPYAPGRFVALSSEVLGYLLTLSGAEKAVALLWLVKWDRDTCGGQYPRPVRFAFSDVELYGVCVQRTFMAARRRLEGQLFRRAKTGRGSANLYLPCFAPEGNECTQDQLSSATEITPSCAADCLPSANKICSSDRTNSAGDCIPHGTAGEKGCLRIKGGSPGEKVCSGSLALEKKITKRSKTSERSLLARGDQGSQGLGERNRDLLKRFKDLAPRAQGPSDLAALVRDLVEDPSWAHEDVVALLRSGWTSIQKFGVIRLVAECLAKPTPFVDALRAALRRNGVAA